MVQVCGLTTLFWYIIPLGMGSWGFDTKGGGVNFEQFVVIIVIRLIMISRSINIDQI